MKPMFLWQNSVSLVKIKHQDPVVSIVSIINSGIRYSKFYMNKFCLKRWVKLHIFIHVLIEHSNTPFSTILAHAWNILFWNGLQLYDLQKKKLVQTGLTLKTNFENIARDVRLKVKSTLHILSKSITKCPVAAYAFRVPSILCLYVVRVSSFTSFILPEMPTTNTPLRKLLSLPNLTDFDWQIYKLCNNDTDPTKSITRWTKFW